MHTFFLLLLLLFPISEVALCADGSSVLSKDLNAIFAKKAGSQDEYAAQLTAIISLLKEAEQKHTLTTSALFDVLHNDPPHPVVFQLLNENINKDTVKRLYTECIIELTKLAKTPQSIDDEISVALYLSQISRNSRDDRLLQILRKPPLDALDFSLHATLALAFSDSMRPEIILLAKKWSALYRALPQSPAEIGYIGTELNRLLAACSTDESYDEIILNANINGLTSDQMDAVRLLSKSHYMPAYDYCKKLALDPKNEAVARLSALEAMASIAVDRFDDIRKIADEFLKDSIFFEYRDRLSALAKPL